MISEKLYNYANSQLPRVLTQMDRDPDSPTYGCFDRNYWHYKIRDFPSAILQQGGLTLEAIRTGLLTWKAPQSIIESWCVAAVNAFGRQIDSQGRVEEYYPFEGSYPAAAFGLYAVGRLVYDWQTNASHLPSQVDQTPLQRLAKALAKRVESRASNQQAAGLAGLALAVKLDLISTEEARLNLLADQLFTSQHEEGWFEEYGGADFGYLTVTLDALADYYDVTGDDRALKASDRAIEFLATVMGVDGALPWTLNSRNTDYIVPYGLAKAGQRNPYAAWILNHLFQNLDSPTHFLRATDDRYHCHYIFASVVRCLPHLATMLPPQPFSWKPSIWLSGCGFWRYQSPDDHWSACVGTKKGGLVRIHRQSLSPVTDNGWRVYQSGQIWTNNWHDQRWEVTREGSAIAIGGQLQRGKFQVPNPYKHFVLRLFARLLGERLIPLLKRALIFQPRGGSGAVFERVITIDETGVSIKDTFTGVTEEEVMASPRQNLRHVASADSFSLEEWSESLAEVERHFSHNQLTIRSRWESN
ncbi:hypothetical protein PCC7418_1409 [Halothece sp. PCC 7418]|uniref:hypothetical protein n=1 Tax=Halothece sp. (strain PCC 7418) TaxID=65093 RepID=UPI0002A08D0A|nr:hypothetical protein [Halothece sp. PCC 7418]AFZ43604.1 hypothetical protein PCC7418_1409 [Halothece sp. PCC 7418]